MFNARKKRMAQIAQGKQDIEKRITESIRSLSQETSIKVHFGIKNMAEVYANKGLSYSGSYPQAIHGYIQDEANKYVGSSFQFINQFRKEFNISLDDSQLDNIKELIEKTYSDIINSTTSHFNGNTQPWQLIDNLDIDKNIELIRLEERIKLSAAPLKTRRITRKFIYNSLILLATIIGVVVAIIVGWDTLKRFFQWIPH